MDVRGQRVLIFGDSLTQRGSAELVNVTEPPNRASSAPGDLLASWLLASGAAAARLDARSGRSGINFWGREATQQLLQADAQWKPSLVVVMLGTNDIGRHRDQTVLALAKIRDAYRAMGAQVIAIGPPSFTRADLQQGSQSVVDVLHTVFGARNVIDARPLSADLAGSQFRTSDQVHFTREGAAVLAQRLAGALFKLGGFREKLTKLKPLGIGLGATLGIGLVGFGLIWISKRRTKLLAGDDYQMRHRPSKGPRLYNLLEDDLLPADVYEKPHFYTGYTEKAYLDETMRAIRAARGNPDALITVYRAAPKGAKAINEGDWITLSRSYAVGHSKHPKDPTQDMKIYKARVPASSIRFAGDDLMEYGYWGTPVKTTLGMTKKERHDEIEDERTDPVVDVASRAIVPFLGVRPYDDEAFRERLNESKESPKRFKATAERVVEVAQQIKAEGRAFGGRKVFIGDVAKRLGVPTKSIAGPLLIANNRGWLELARADMTFLMDQDKVASSEIEGPDGIARYHFVVIG
jgi:lysophospholipase L1-like esterase